MICSGGLRNKVVGEVIAETTSVPFLLVEAFSGLQSWSDINWIQPYVVLPVLLTCLWCCLRENKARASLSCSQKEIGYIYIEGGMSFPH